MQQSKIDSISAFGRRNLCVMFPASPRYPGLGTGYQAAGERRVKGESLMGASGARAGCDVPTYPLARSPAAMSRYTCNRIVNGKLIGFTSSVLRYLSSEGTRFRFKLTQIIVNALLTRLADSKRSRLELRDTFDFQPGTIPARSTRAEALDHNTGHRECERWALV
ncbi:hypothetical protein EVAR_27977_1 [Eumeta japonica]|uniref:Uncharacterized protein n=1 Tax=Eumeta variegata TaxID=151549 RepID=A0A4C1WC04_EUMVA|nr:hypothetical protein EVAR_27977_1 [Eumeta japonica]